MTSDKPRRPGSSGRPQETKDPDLPFSRFRRTAGGLEDRDAIDQLTKAVRRLIPPRLPGKKQRPVAPTPVKPPADRQPARPGAKPED